MTNNDEFIEYERILNSIPSIEFQNRSTYIDISGYPNYETVISNLYAYFLENRKGNNFSKLFMDSLNDCIPEVNLILEDYQVIREKITDTGGRIDIVIQEKGKSEDKKAIFIENKIYHTLLNDLDDYYDALGKRKSSRIGIVLTLNDTHVKKPYYNITHKQWIDKIKLRLGEYISKSDGKQLFILQDFIEHIDSFYTKSTNMETMNFLFEYGSKIQKLNDLEYEGFSHLVSESKRAILNTNWSWSRTNNWSINLKSANDSVYLYLITDNLYSEHLLNTSLWLKGIRIVEQWNNTEFYKRTNDVANNYNIELNDNKAKLKEWAHVGTKKFDFQTSSELINFGDFLIKEILPPWENLIEKLKTNFKF